MSREENLRQKERIIAKRKNTPGWKHFFKEHTEYLNRLAKWNLTCDCSMCGGARKIERKKNTKKSRQQGNKEIRWIGTHFKPEEL